MRTLILAITSAFYLAPFAEAQSSFTQNQLNQLNARNSSSFYTGQREASRVVNQAIPRYNFSNVNQGLLKAATGGSMSSRQKPFSQVQRGPSTSPYMGLISDNPFTSSTTNYFTNVRPQLEQQRMNERLQAQNIRMQQQLNEIAAKGPYSTTGSEERAPTGHAAVYQNDGGVYGNHGAYYPQVPIRSVRGQR